MVGAGEVSAEEAHAVGVVSGLSVEDKQEIKAAWADAPEERRGSASGYLRANGFDGDTVAALFTDFNLRGTEVQVGELLGKLRGAPIGFDPDAIPE